MAVTDELKSLEEMKAKGTLTDAEFASAKAATISKYQSGSTQPASAPLEVARTKASKSGIASKLVVAISVILGMWFIVQSNVKGKPTTEILKAATRMPIDLTNEVENLSASSWRAVPIQLPFDGSLTISAQVTRGNPIEMFLTDSAKVEDLKAGNRRASYYGGFYASKASTFQHTARLSEGTYYLVLRDTSLGILSSSTSDVSVKARLEP